MERALKSNPRRAPAAQSRAATFPIWPRERSTAAALSVLVVCQMVSFFVVTDRAFFVGEDYYNFQLARETSFLRYLATPLLHVYPAPGHRLVTFVFQRLFPLDYTVSRLFLLVVLAATTIILAQLVRTFARSEEWWTVPLLVPFALSETLVSAVWWWSNGLPVIPALFFTALALSAWLRSYTTPHRRFWIGVTVAAIAAAGGFYMKFLLIPVYLLFMRAMIFPRLFTVPSDLRSLWSERARWIAVAAPPALFLVVFVLSGLAGRTAVPGDRPYLSYFATAWFKAFVPVAFLNAQLEGSTSSAARVIIIASQGLFWFAVAATCVRSSLAVRGWALFVLAFFTNTAMVGTLRLATHGLAIAYWVRYYPEIVFFLPMALALGLRQGAARRPGLAWERTTLGRIAIGLSPILYLIGFAVWAPQAVSASDGVRARLWFDNLRGGIAEATADQRILQIVDSEAPDYIIASWVGPYNRISDLLSIIDLKLAYNELSESTRLVLEDGRLAKAEFRPITPLLSGKKRAGGVHIAQDVRSRSDATCISSGADLRYVPAEEIVAKRLAMRVIYAGKRRLSVPLDAETADPDRPFRHLQLDPSKGAELIELGTTGVRGLKVGPVPGGGVCIQSLDIGSLTGR
jgi:hypothetical protein